jgi:cytochrome c
MLKNPSFKTYIALGLLLGVWVAMFAHYGSMVVYRPGDIEHPAYPLIATEEAPPVEEAAAPVEEAAAEEQPAETATTETAAPAGGGDGIAALLAAADMDAGAKISKKCAACHSFNKDGKNKVGPNLWDIVGKSIAGGEGYKFSGALAGMGGEWTYDNLDAFLTKPKDFAPGTKMSFAGIKGAGDRANLIAFLRGLSDDPKPLP